QAAAMAPGYLVCGWEQLAGGVAGVQYAKQVPGIVPGLDTAAFLGQLPTHVPQLLKAVMIIREAAGPGQSKRQQADHGAGVHAALAPVDAFHLALVQAS